VAYFTPYQKHVTSSIYFLAWSCTRQQHQSFSFCCSSYLVVSRYQKQSDTLTPLSSQSSSVPLISRLTFTMNQRYFLTELQTLHISQLLPSMFSLRLTPSTTKSIHFSTHSLSSFLNRWPHNLTLLCHSWEERFIPNMSRLIFYLIFQ